MPDTKIPEKFILRIREVSALTGVPAPSIHRRYRAGSFPVPLRLGQNSIGWRRDEIVAWLDSLPRATDALGEIGGGAEKNKTAAR